MAGKSGKGEVKKRKRKRKRKRTTEWRMRISHLNS